MSTEPNGVLRRNSNLQIAIAVIGLIILIGGPIYNLASRVDAHDLAINNIHTQNTQSFDNRTILSKQVDENKASLFEMREKLSNEVTERNAKLVEVETQFASTENKINSFIANQERLNAIMWNKIGTLGTYPSAPYFFSNISQHER